MKAKKSDKIKVEYEGKLDNGEVFDTTNREGFQQPLELVIGEGKIISAFEEEIIGMEKGEEKEFKIPPEKAYGPINPEAKREFPKELVPPGQELKSGMTIVLKTQNNQQFPAKVEEIKDKTIVLDLNHPLAGQNLNFRIKIVDIKSS